MVTFSGLGVLLMWFSPLVSDDDVAGEERSRRREAHLHGAARERLLRALPGTETSDEKIGDELLLLMPVVAEEEVSVVMVGVAATAEVGFEFVVGEMRWRL